MPIGPTGEKRPADVIANAVHVAKIATGEIEEEYVDQTKRAGARTSGTARDSNLTPDQRREIAKKAAARWADRE